MAPNLLSALTISTLGLASKAFLNFACKSVNVRGLETLLDALKEEKVVVKADAKEKAKGKAFQKEHVEQGHDGGEREGSVTPGTENGTEVETEWRRRGIVTICNHISVVDDPTMWGVMPLSTYFPFATPRHTSRNTRWTLGASDIMFTTSVRSKFFNLGQVIETVRGGGIFQPAIDEAVKKLHNGDWIHIFPEGKVNQVSLNPRGGLNKFKWGVSRIIMDCETIPIVIPIWISGFDDVMPDTRKYLRGIPRPGHKVSVTVGEPITSKIIPLMHEWRRLSRKEKSSRQDQDPDRAGEGIGGKWSENASEVDRRLQMETDAAAKLNIANSRQPSRKNRQDRSQSLSSADGSPTRDEVQIRIDMTNLLFSELETLGKRVEKEEGKVGNAWRNAVPNPNYTDTKAS